jgi:hypothetical protein
MLPTGQTGHQIRTIFGNFIMFGAFVYGWQSDDSVFSYKEKVPSEEKS